MTLISSNEVKTNTKYYMFKNKYRCGYCGREFFRTVQRAKESDHITCRCGNVLKTWE